MSTDRDSSSTGLPAKSKPFPRKGFRFLGLGLQDVIRYFFGGNAALAIVVLVLICVFLAIEAFWFFPQHHHEYRLYRQSGQEAVDLVKAEVDAHTRLGGGLNIAYLSEVNESSKREDQVLNALLQVGMTIENRTRKTWDRLEEARQVIENLPKEIEEEEDPEKQARLTLELETAKQREAALANQWEKEAAELLDDPGTWELEGNKVSLTAEETSEIWNAVLAASPGTKPEFPYFEAIRKRSSELKATARERLVAFKSAVTDLRGAIGPLRDLQNKLRETGMENRRVLDKFETAPARRRALIKGAAATDDPAEKARKLEMAEAVVIETPDYAALSQPVYDSIPQHEALVGPLLETVGEAYARMPATEVLSTPAAREKLRDSKKAFEEFQFAVSRAEERLPEWRHDKPMSPLKTVLAFFVGKDWVTNSSWHEFYGLLPLFFGSLVISVIALVVSVPFAVAGAVYVNQLASQREQNFIKPAIEFIQAIPSVVLGFFGILVLGTALRELSQVEWLSWVPGFPMSERLNMLNAGLLLAFMAIPTIFTLAEDALNNVPGAFSEASLALGASKLQTVAKVIMPTAISGIIAAILLGFGRIIGETMVVLLVAGNKIQIPDFTMGIGVVTQPAHTMTGIIAQELGEVDKGSLHWRALFMVGMVLFVISLSINFAAQRILKKFHEAY